MSTEVKSNIISELSKMLGVPVRAINVRDPNVFEREQRTTKSTTEDLSFRQAVRFECEGLKTEIRSNGSYLVLEVKAPLNAGSWSINEPDQITRTHRLGKSSMLPDEMPLFVMGSELTAKAREILRSRVFSELLRKLGLGECESLHFYKNAVAYYSRSASAVEFLERSRFICGFIAQGRGWRATQRMVELPELFSDLNEYGQMWAISDDSEREQAIESASSETLKDLVENVSPRLPSINTYLNTHTDEKAVALGNLAETVAEAKIVLQAV